LFFSHREYTSNSEEPNDTQESEIQMNRRMNASPHPPSQQPSMNYNRQQAAPPVKKTVQHDPDVYVSSFEKHIKRFVSFRFSVTQSRSFQMLQGWISDSEKQVPAPAPQQPQQPTSEQQANINKSAGKIIYFSN